MQHDNDVDARDPQRASLRLDPDMVNLAAARHAVRDVLDAAGRDDLHERASLVATELVANAVAHAGTEVDLHMEAGPDGLRLEVGDGSPLLPEVRQAPVTGTSGRGMSLVTSLSDAWGVDQRDDAKAVWVEIRGTTEP